MTHCDQVLALLKTQISSEVEVEEIHTTAAKVANKWVNPSSGGREEINGLIYGLVQSGKTGVLTVTGAMGIDAGYGLIVILTTDIKTLYNQTLGRVREAFPGLDTIFNDEFKDTTAFLHRIKSWPCAIVTTKNVERLDDLIQNFKVGGVRELSALIIDDEGDQASLNTRARRADGTRSAVNQKITELRGFFQKSTYLQVTATPAALFLQTKGHEFRPKFTVLSHPGSDYVGGEEFFGDGSQLVENFALNDITVVAPGAQPAPRLTIPNSLLRALDTFMIGATFKRQNAPTENCAFLCHVSTRNADHGHMVNLMLKYKMDLTADLKAKNQSLRTRLKVAYDALALTHEPLRGTEFDDLVKSLDFYSPGIAVKLVNKDTDDDVAVQSPYNLFVGGNKLGRGVTIKNLLVSYYGRHPRTPQADTILQHARMYGYRRKDIGLLRLFLPQELHDIFRAINTMERALRVVVDQESSEDFRGLFLSEGLSPTRRSVLGPGALNGYFGGGTYNPAMIRFDDTVKTPTAKMDKLLADIHNKQYVEMSFAELQALIKLTLPDEQYAGHLWDSSIVAGSLGLLTEVHRENTGYVYVDRERGLKAIRTEGGQGILSSHESTIVPKDKFTLFLLRTKAEGQKNAAWWPQVRFPAGRYGIAFKI